MTCSPPVIRSRRTICVLAVVPRVYSISVADTKRPPGIASAQSTFGLCASLASNRPTTPSAPIGFASARTETSRAAGQDALTAGSASGVRVAVGAGVAVAVAVGSAVCGDGVAVSAAGVALGAAIEGVGEGDADGETHAVAMRSTSGRPLLITNRRTASLRPLSAVAGGRDDDRRAGDVGHPATEVGSEKVDREPVRLRVVEVTVHAELVRRELGRLRAGRAGDVGGPRDLDRREPAVIGGLRVPALQLHGDLPVAHLFERA